ncbi:MAG: hypothetical protein OXC09_03165 [Truepera sp.]|nr:hypothetical protein [Truepera sp.]
MLTLWLSSELVNLPRMPSFRKGTFGSVWPLISLERGPEKPDFDSFPPKLESSGLSLGDKRCSPEIVRSSTSVVDDFDRYMRVTHHPSALLEPKASGYQEVVVGHGDAQWRLDVISCGHLSPLPRLTRRAGFSWDNEFYVGLTTPESTPRFSGATVALQGVVL